MGNFVENISPWSIKQKKIAEREEYLILLLSDKID